MLTRSFHNECTAFALLIFVLLLCCSNAEAFKPDDDCLWISYGERIRGTNNEAVIPIRINFGRFPDKRKELSVLTGLKVFYLVNSGSSDSEWTLKNLDLTRPDRDGFIHIKTHEHDHLLIYAVAEISAGGYKTVYSAKSGFNRFTGKKPLKPVYIGSIVMDSVRLDIFPRFHYWRQTGERLKIASNHLHTGQPAENMFVLDEHLAPEMIVPAKDGTASYQFPDDRILNEQSSAASKTAVVVAEKTSRDVRYVATFSLQLHRNRFMHRNQVAGVAVFAGTALLALGLVLWRRKKSEF